MIVRVAAGILVTALFRLVPASPTSAESPPVQAPVLRVIDGDIIPVWIGNTTELVEVIALVLPPRGPCGPERQS